LVKTTEVVEVLVIPLYKVAVPAELWRSIPPERLLFCSLFWTSILKS